MRMVKLALRKLSIYLGWILRLRRCRLLKSAASCFVVSRSCFGDNHSSLNNFGDCFYYSFAFYFRNIFVFLASVEVLHLQGGLEVGRSVFSSQILRDRRSSCLQICILRFPPSICMDLSCSLSELLPMRFFRNSLEVTKKV